MSDDRGLYQVGKRWYLRIAIHGQMQRFGKPLGFRTKDEARIFRDRLRASLRDRTQFPGTEQTEGTVKELCTAYLDDIQGKKASYRDKKRHLDFWTDQFGDRPIMTLQSANITQSLSMLRKKCSNATANRYAETLRAMMRRKVKPKFWVIEFWSEVELFPEDERVMPIYTAEDLAKVFDAAEERDALLIYLALLLGLRRGLLCALRWEWVNWPQGVIRLPSYKRQQAFTLPLSAHALAILLHFHAEQGKPTEGWIFPARIQNSEKVNFGVHIDAHNWYTRTFKPLLRSLNLGHLTFHALRRTWATALGEKAPQRIVQVLGNWADAKVTERYSNPQDASLRAAMEGVAESLGTAILRPVEDKPGSQKLAKILKIKRSPRSSVG